MTEANPYHRGQQSVWRSLLSQCLAVLGPDDPQAELAGLVAEIERLRAENAELRATVNRLHASHVTERHQPYRTAPF